MQKSPTYPHECNAQRARTYSQTGKLFSGAPTPKSSTDAIFIWGKGNQRASNTQNNQEICWTSLQKTLLGRSQAPAGRPGGTRALWGPGTGGLPGHGGGTRTHRASRAPRYKGNRSAVARGGSCILRREMVLPPSRGRPRESGRTRQPLTREAAGEGRARRASPGTLPGLPARMALPAPADPRLLRGEGLFRGGEEGSRLLTWAPRFC